MPRSMKTVRADPKDEKFIGLMQEFSPVPGRFVNMNDFPGETCEELRSSDRKITCFSSRNITSIENNFENCQELDTNQIYQIKKEVKILEERLTLNLKVLSQNMEKTNCLIKYVEKLEMKNDKKKKNKGTNENGCNLGCNIW